MITRAALLSLAALVVGGWLLAQLAPVLTPFVAAALLAYLVNPPVTRLARHMPRTAATSLVFVVLTLLFLAATLIALPQLQNQITALLRALPRFLDWLERTGLPWLAVRADIPPQTFSLDAAREWLQTHWASAGQLVARGAMRVIDEGLGLAGALMTLVLVPVVTFYLLRDWPRLIAACDGLLPRRVAPDVRRLAREADAVLGGFLHGQLLVMLSQGAFYAVALSLVGLQQAFAIGFTAGLVTFVPYLGAVVGFMLGGVVAVIQFQALGPVLLVLGVFALGQVLEQVLLTPLLVGDRVGLHPVAVIFAVLAGGELFGFFGVLLALPAAAVLWVLLREGLRRYRASGVYDAPPLVADDPPPPAVPAAAAPPAEP
jgi:predicted PurR-regulated permease PerM